MVICNAIDYNESPQQGSSSCLWKCKRVFVNQREEDNEFELDHIVHVAGFPFFVRFKITREINWAIDRNTDRPQTDKIYKQP